MTNHSAVDVRSGARRSRRGPGNVRSSAELIQAPAAHVAEFVAQLRREFVGAIVNSATPDGRTIGKARSIGKTFSPAPLRRRRWCGGIKDGKAARAALIASGICSRGEGSRQQDTCVLLALLFSLDFRNCYHSCATASGAGAFLCCRCHGPVHSRGAVAKPFCG